MKSSVDRSKPSTACGPCRQRRAKCDRRRPQCSQCTRTSRVCHGYRQHLDLVLRDETPKFERDVQSDPGDLPTRSTSMLSLANLKQNSNDFAINYFSTSFVNGCYMDYIPQLYLSTDRSVQFDASFGAVALSFLAKKERREDLLQSAREKYSVALHETRQALATPKKATTDDNIASVLLLALFAAFNCDPQEAGITWTKHLHGALALLNARDPGSFGSPTSQNILGHVVGSIELDCLQRRVPQPSAVSEVCKRSIFGEIEFQRQFWEFSRALSKLEALSVHPSIAPLSLFITAISLDERAKWLLESMPLMHSQGSTSEPSARSATCRTLQAWNTLRLLRMKVSELIVAHGTGALQLSFERHQQDWLRTSVEKSAKVIVALVEQICDSVPEFLRASDDKGGRQEKDAWICSLLLPLECCITSVSVPEKLKQHAQLILQEVITSTHYQSFYKLSPQASTNDVRTSGLYALYLC